MNKPISLSRSIRIWRAVQLFVWLIGLGIVFSLVFSPDIGLHLTWNILIPVAPALLVIITGVWRNVCPIAFTFLLPKRFGFSKSIKLSDGALARLSLASVAALLIIVPARHLSFNTNAMATAVILSVIGLTAFIAGSFFLSKSSWCSGLCPIHPVEKLYGSKVSMSLPNAHCTECRKCVIPCPDSTPGINPLSIKKSVYSRIAGLLIAGGFPGYVWGWFQVQDYNGMEGFNHLGAIYGYPFGGMLISVALFLLLQKFFPKTNVLVNIFAAAAVSFYYWFRIPNLFGFGTFHGDGMLVDLSSILSPGAIYFLGAGVAAFFFWWLVVRSESRSSWLIRPEYAKETL